MKAQLGIEISLKAPDGAELSSLSYTGAIPLPLRPRFVKKSSGQNEQNKDVSEFCLTIDWSV